MAARRKRILLVTISLRGGGAEKVVSTLLQHLDRTRFEPVLVIFINKIEYPVPPDVPVICLDKKKWWDYPKLVFKLTRVYRQWHPDTVLSVLRYANVISALAKMISRLKFELLVSEHGMPSFSLSGQKDLITLISEKWLPSWLYKKAGKVICVSDGLASDIHHLYGVPLEKIKIIRNPLDVRSIVEQCRENVDHPWFAESLPVVISVGRLSPIKGYPYLLKAFKQVLAVCPSRLMILGKGEEEQPLKEMAGRLGIEEHVAFIGFQPNPYKFMARSRLLVLSSNSEAFPMVILEAMVCGLPIVSTDCPGPCEMLQDGVSGLIVPRQNDQALAKAIITVLTDEALAANLVRAAAAQVQQYSVETIVQEYQALFE